MKTLTEVRAEFAALSNVTEDQFEANLATALSDLDAIIGAGQSTAVTTTSLTQNLSDGTTVEFVPKA